MKLECVFVYGTLKKGRRSENVAQCEVGFRMPGIFKVNDYRIKEIRGTCLPAMTAEPGFVTLGELITVCADCLRRLDWFEGGYRRETVTALFEDDSVFDNVFAYVVDNDDCLSDWRELEAPGSYGLTVCSF